jgi:phosphate uptake regulator
MAWDTPSRERRVLKAGHSSIAVTLPKPWAQAMHLRPGDLVVFDQNDEGTLYLKPAPAPGASPGATPYLIQARAFDVPGVLERLVVGAYRAGHDAIEIRTDLALSAERLEELHQAARGLLGVSVVAAEPNRVVLQNFIDPSKYGLPQLVQRMKMILIAFLEETETIVARGIRSRRLGSLEEEADKVLALLVRQLILASRDWSLARRIGSPDPRHLLEWRVVVQALEGMARLLGRAATELNRQPSDHPEREPEVAALLREIKEGLKRSVDALMHPSLLSACEAYGESARLASEAREIHDRLKGAARRIGLSRALSAFERSAASIGELAEVALDRAVAVGTEIVLLDAS